MTTLHFAQISDIHISVMGDHHDMLSGRSAGFLTDILANLEQVEDLDFVLISGDLFDFADWSEFEHFQQIISSFSKPYYVIPGNHDRRLADRPEGLTRRDFAQRFNPQVEARPTAPEAQAGYWSIAINSAVQLIGLDSIRDKDWGGVIDAEQMDWLSDELAQHANKAVVLAVHHPIHPISPIDSHPDWTNFVCDTGPELLALLDASPQVKLVLTGHHHMSKVDSLGKRIHAACPSIAIYPCAYRTFHLTQQADDGWQLTWQSHNATDEATIAEAREVMFNSWQEVGFDADFVREHVSIALGSDHDRQGETVL